MVTSQKNDTKIGLKKQDGIGEEDTVTSPMPPKS